MPQPLKAVIIDDEPLAIERLEFLLGRIGDLAVAGSARTSRAGLALVRDLAPDVVFLDIRMPEMTGLELVEQLKGAEAPAIVFVTAHSRYAHPAFDLEAVDYLLKPIEFDRLSAAVERVRKTLRAQAAQTREEELVRVIAALREDQADAPAEPYEKEFWVTGRKAVVRVPVDSVLWARAEGDYVRLHAADRSYLIRNTITRVAGLLDPARFMRIHRSVIVRTDHVQKVERASGSRLWVELASGERISVGRLYLQTVRDWIAGRSGLQR